MYINSHLTANIGIKMTHVTENESVMTNDYQFLIVQKGTIILKFDHTEKKFLHEESIILIPPGKPFTCSPYTPNTVIGLRIDTPYINSLIPSGHIIECDSSQEAKRDYKTLHQILIRICSTLYTDNNEMLMTALIYELSNCLSKNFIIPVNEQANNDVEQLNQERILLITNYINAHYHQPLHLTTLAEKMFLSQQYLSKFIKKNLGTTFIKYLTTVRLEHAHTELLKTENSITHIALNNGFPNISAFNKAFREKYKESPNSYRNHYASKKPQLPSKKEYEAYKQAINPSSVHIQTEKGNAIAHQKPWLDTINIGAMTEILKVSFQKNFIEFYKAIPIKYIRCNNIFDKEIIRFDPNTQKFNFTNLNLILDFLYKLQIFPFIELTFKPPEIEMLDFINSADHHLYDEEQENSFYYKALSALLKHVISRYDMQYISQWRFEVWAKHKENLTFIETPEMYGKRYMGFYEIIKNFLPTCEVGGPGYNACNTSKHFKTFFDFFTSKKIPFDFISLNVFSYKLQPQNNSQDLTTIGIVSPDSNHIYHMIKKYQTLLKKSLYADTPIYITEFGSTLTSMQNYIPLTTFQATFLCKNLLSLFTEFPCVAYVRFMDYSSRSRWMPENIFPSIGLLSFNGIPKPSYHAYSLLSKLGNDLISHGEHYVMTANTQNDYQLLFYHYEHFNESYCFNSLDPVKPEYTYAMFEVKEDLNMHFICDNIPSGRYKVVKHTLNRTFGSIFDRYLTILNSEDTTYNELLTTIMNFSEDELNYFKHISVPRKDIYYFTCKDKIELTFKLASHEIIFFEYIKIR